MLDGCSRFQILWRVMVPLMGPGILTAGIFMFLFAFQEYLTANVLTDVVARTVPVFIATQLGQTLPMLQQAGAAAMLLTLPVIGVRLHRPALPGGRPQRRLGQGLNRAGAGCRWSCCPGMNCSARLWAAAAAAAGGTAVTPVLDRPRARRPGRPPARRPAGRGSRSPVLSLGGIVAMALIRRGPGAGHRLVPARDQRPCRPPTPSAPPGRTQLDRLACRSPARDLQRGCCRCCCCTTRSRDGCGAPGDGRRARERRAGPPSCGCRAPGSTSGRACAGVAVPTLVLAGRGDVLCPVERHEEIAALVPGARLTSAGCGHLLPMERGPSPGCCGLARGPRAGRRTTALRRTGAAAARRRRADAAAAARTPGAAGRDEPAAAASVQQGALSSRAECPDDAS